MSKWGLVYLLLPLAAVAVFGAAPFLGWSLPENVSTLGAEIDALYYFILAITSIVFLATQGVLVWIVIRYSRRPEGGAAVYVHGSRRLEIVWTAVPAVLLTVLTIAQVPTWVKLRFPGSRPAGPPLARVVARQFEWRVTYPGPDGAFDTFDDIHSANELHIPRGETVQVELRSMDVIHSFNLPHLRLKHDIVPGLRIAVWFDAQRSTREYQAQRADFAAGELADAGGLLELWRATGRPIDEYLATKLPNSLAGELPGYDPHFQPEALTLAAIASFLNGTLADAQLYSPERFPTESLPAAVREHLALDGGVYLPLLNRQLLEHAYPRMLKPLRQEYPLVCTELCGWGHANMQGKLVVHDTRAELQQWLERRRSEQESVR